MYNYIDDISKIAQEIITKYLNNKKIAIDCTLGNGHDTNFLRQNFKKVYSFDIQKEPCEIYKTNNYENVTIINKSHEYLQENIIEHEVDCIMYNLGFLPGSNDKTITTKKESTLISIKKGLQLLAYGGIMSICVYIGHDEGRDEETCIVKFLESLPKKEFAVMEHRYINRSVLAPRLFIIERNSK